MWFPLTAISIASFSTGQGKLEKVREFVWSWKVKESQEKWSWIMQTADFCDFLGSVNIKKQANSHLPLNILTLEMYIPGTYQVRPHLNPDE